MKMFDGLAAVGSGIDGKTVAPVEMLDPGNLARCGHQRTEQRGVLRQRVRM